MMRYRILLLALTLAATLLQEHFDVGRKRRSEFRPCKPGRQPSTETCLTAVRLFCVAPREGIQSQKLPA